MIKLFGFNISTEDKIIADRVCSMLSGSSEVIDLRSFEPESNNNDILLIFGERAVKLTKNLPYKIKEIFPDFAKLSPDFGEQEEIEQARRKFKLLKRRLEEPEKIITVKEDRKIYTEESLPDASTAQILKKLEDIINNKSQKEWILYTKNNKSVRITIEPEISNADVDITFAELYTLRMAMETLKAKEVEIVYRNNNNRKKDTS